MLKYGGVYADTDAIFVRSLTDRVRAYDVVFAYDWIDWDAPFPDTINLGVVVSKPQAPFWRHQQVEYVVGFVSKRHVSKLVELQVSGAGISNSSFVNLVDSIAFFASAYDFMFAQIMWANVGAIGQSSFFRLSFVWLYVVQLVAIHNLLRLNFRVTKIKFS